MADRRRPPSGGAGRPATRRALVLGWLCVVGLLVVGGVVADSLVPLVA